MKIIHTEKVFALVQNIGKTEEVDEYSLFGAICRIIMECKTTNYAVRRTTISEQALEKCSHFMAVEHDHQVTKTKLWVMPRGSLEAFLVEVEG